MTFEERMALLQLKINLQTQMNDLFTEQLYTFEGMADPNSPMYKMWLSMMASTKQQIQLGKDDIDKWTEEKELLWVNRLPTFSANINKLDTWEGLLGQMHLHEDAQPCSHGGHDDGCASDLPFETRLDKEVTD